jgi:hypothetical protein
MHFPTHITPHRRYKIAVPFLQADIDARRAAHLSCDIQCRIINDEFQDWYDIGTLQR